MRSLAIYITVTVLLTALVGLVFDAVIAVVFLVLWLAACGLLFLLFLLLKWL
ncbi:MAG: hypothetical protein LBR34_11770 [Prevotella sp.]|jgi:hypothetical protein|nr:hypothetical protein [Prevotella sp.]